MEAAIREARAAVLELWNRTADLECKALADEVYKKLSTVLRAWNEERP